MKHYRSLRHIVSFVLCMVLLCGLGLSGRASAFTWPNSYWAIQKAWNDAVASNDPAQIISAAENAYEVLMTYEKNAIVYGYSELICGHAAQACETKGDLNGAILWLQRQQTLDQWLTDNGTDYSPSLINIKPRLAFLEAAVSPAIYALSDNAESPYAYGPRHGTWYGSIATEDGAKSGESAVLVYIHFFDGYSVEYWLNYYKNTLPEFKKAATEGGVIELAWNFSPENTDSVRKVLDPANDAYINEGLRAISQLNATVLLRVGAEMNAWLADCDPATFRAAYQKVATEARKYSNIQMSWSPVDVGNQQRTWDDYWPGDQYVDWVGMSSYRNNAPRYMHQTSTPADYADYAYALLYQDAYYGQGVYASNPLIACKSLMDFAAEHNKPVMISECGFGYYNKQTGTDQTAGAADLLTRFYSYVNMIYPQVKAVFYFNDVGGTGVAETSKGYSYRLDKNATVNNAYETAVSNGSYLSFGQTDCLNWEPLNKTTLKSGEGKLKLATYALIPGSASATTTVHYYVDGQWKASRPTAPYTFELDLSALSAGKHTVQAVAICTDGSRTVNVKTEEYTIEVPGSAATPAVKFTDVPADEWYADPVLWAVDKNITLGTGEGKFSPSTECTQIQILTFLWRAAERPNSSVEPAVAVTENADYAGAARWATEKGMIDANFKPYDPCTRASAVKFIWQAMDAPKAGSAASFSDVAADAPYADAVSWAVEKRVTQGTSATTFEPNTVCDRGTIVTFLYRAYK